MVSDAGSEPDPMLHLVRLYHVFDSASRGMLRMDVQDRVIIEELRDFICREVDHTAELVLPSGKKPACRIVVEVLIKSARQLLAEDDSCGHSKAYAFLGQLSLSKEQLRELGRRLDCFIENPDAAWAKDMAVVVDRSFDFVPDAERGRARPLFKEAEEA